MAKYLTDRQDRKIGDTIRKVDGLNQAVGRREHPTLLSTGTDFGSIVVPRTTITAASRIPQAGSDIFTPGTGTAYFFKVSDTGSIEPRNDKFGNVIWKTVYNLNQVSYEPNADQSPLLELQGGGTLEMQDGSSFELQLNTTVTDFIGTDTAILKAVQDWSGKHVIPPQEQVSIVPTTIKLERAIIGDVPFPGIKPDSSGPILVFVDQQVDDNPTAATTNTIQLAIGANTTDDFYNDWMIQIVDGTGLGQTRFIKDYTGSTRTASIGCYGGLTQDWVDTPTSQSVYKLYKPSPKTGIWSNAAGGLTLRKNEMVWVQKMSLSNHYEIIRPTDRSLLRALVRQSGGIPDGTEGEITIIDSGVITTGIWQFMTAGMSLDFVGEIVVSYHDTSLEGLDKDCGNRYRIWGADCNDMSDTSA